MAYQDCVLYIDTICKGGTKVSAARHVVLPFMPFVGLTLTGVNSVRESPYNTEDTFVVRAIGHIIKEPPEPEYSLLLKIEPQEANSFSKRTLAEVKEWLGGGWIYD
jgi:hypothetical protein